MDWFSRFVLSWELSNTMEIGFCLAAPEAAFRFGQPEIWNSDQGSQFTSIDFLAPLKKRGMSISMDGRGRALDNVFIERLWRSLKYELASPRFGHDEPESLWAGILWESPGLLLGELRGIDKCQWPGSLIEMHFLLESDAVESPADECLRRAQWQDIMFAERPRRGDLLALKGSFRVRPLRVRVHRNQPFEFVAAVMGPFLAYAGYSAEMIYSPYDDSIGAGDRSGADVEIVWLDYARYENIGAFPDWLLQRLCCLRSFSTAPILLANAASPVGAWREFNKSLNEVAAHVPGVRVCDLACVADRLGEAYFDLRAAAISAMMLSGQACVELARMFGLKWIPAALNSRIKAIAVDLDNTLYDGVLGEDGPKGVAIKEAHADLHRQLLAFRNAGVFLAIVSRNEPEDVARLFAQRTDFILRPEHFSAQSISWNSKAVGLRDAAAALRIAPDSVLVIDDNAGELAAIANEIPGIQTLHASRPELVCCALRLYPGLTTEPATVADQLRIGDLAASGLRAKLESQSQSAEDYLQSLGVQLSFFFNPGEHLQRLHELSNKTNQFNTAFQRFSEAEVARFIEEPDRAVVAVSLRDKLSDSGLIAAIFGRRAGQGLTIEEIVISCRALGRAIEDVMITEAIRGMMARFGSPGPSKVIVRFMAGPRNQPAAEWLRKYANCTALAGEVAIEWNERDRAATIQEAEKRMRIRWVI